MKHFIVFIIILIIGFMSMKDSHFFSKTNSGERFEYFKTETSAAIPQILATYLFNSKVNYAVYKIPNYVSDLLAYNKDFSIVYKSSPKCSVIIFKPREHVKENEPAFKPFYNKVRVLINNEYNRSFNLIIKEEGSTPDYTLSNDRIAYKDLEEYCGSFCLINPANDTMFVFKRITNSEIEALEALFQQYHFEQQ